jgi:hypothetical protein
VNKVNGSGDKSAQEKPKAVLAGGEDAKYHNHQASKDDLYSTEREIERKLKASANKDVDKKEYQLHSRVDAKQVFKYVPESKLSADNDSDGEYDAIDLNQTRNLSFSPPHPVSSSLPSPKRHSVSSTFLTSPSHLSSSEEDTDENRRDESDEDSLVDAVAGIHPRDDDESDDEDDEDDRAFDALQHEFNGNFSD